MSSFRPRSANLARRLLVIGALAALLILPACSGGATVTAPSAPTGATLSGSFTGAINIGNAMSVFIDVTTGPTSNASDTITVTLDDRDPSTDPVSASANALQGGGLVSIGPIDTTSLMDGPIDVFVEITDLRLATSGQTLLATLTKDTIAPNLIGSLSVIVDSGNLAPGANGLPNVVNRSNVTATAVQLVYDVGSEGGINAQVTLSDGVTTVSSGNVMTATGPNISVVSGIDVSPLSDGMLTLRLTATDAAGNTTVVNGAPVTKDVVVGMATAAGINAGPGNPIDVINIASVGAASVDVTVDLSTVIGSDVLSVELASGMATLTTPAVALDPAAASPVITFSGIDASSLPDGPLTVSALITDVNGNVSTFVGRPGTLDTFIGLPTSVSIPAGMMNPANVVNIATQSALQVDVGIDATAQAGDTVTVEVTDGLTTVTGTTTVPAGAGSVVSVTGLDVSGLTDGILTLRARLSDAATNTSADVIGNGEKGTVPPAPPTTLLVPAGGMNPSGFVNGFTVNAAQIDATFPTSTEPGRTLEITVTDGLAVSVIGTASLAASDTAASVTGLNLSGLAEGALTLSGTITDRFGNTSSPPTLGAATKDTTLANVSSASIPSGAGNNFNFIAIANAAAASFTIVMPASSDGSETVAPTLTDGTSTLMLGMQSAGAGGGNLTFGTIDTTSLLDGTVSVGGTVSDPAGNVATIGPFTFTKDTVAPATPTTYVVAAGPSNAQDVINIASVNAVGIDLDWPANSEAGDTATLTLGDGAATVMSPLQVVPGGGGMASVANIDASSLADGTIMLDGVSSDLAGNTSAFTGTNATKDTVAPPAPASADVIAGAMNPANFFNIASQAAGQVDVVFGAMAVAADTVDVNLTDGTNMLAVATGVASPIGNGILNFPGIDVTALPDGFYDIVVTVTDPAGNPTVFMGTQARKDTVPPDAPTALFVMAGAMNPQDFINAASVGAVSVQIDFGSTYEGTETFFIELDDGATTVTTVTRDAPVGGGTIDFVNVDTTALVDGTITLTAQVLDAAQNPATHGGFSATKDIVAPTASAASVAAVMGQNPADFINLASAAMVSVEVNFDANVVGDETVMVTLTDGTPTALPFTVAAPPAGGGIGTFAGLDASTLVDGAVSLDVMITDPAGNSSTLAGTAATKDTVAPTSVMAVRVVDSGVGVNPAGFINAASAANVSIEIDLDGTSTLGDVIQATLDDGATSLMTPTSLAGGGVQTVMFTGFDASTLVDGSVTVTGSAADAAGNAATLAVTVTKDVVAPLAPTSAAIVMGAMNPAGFINSLTVAAVDVEVVWPVGGDTTANSIVTLTGGAMAMSAGSAPLDNATQTVGGIDASALTDGAVTIAVDVTDPAGNATNFAGTAAMKDVVLPDNPTASTVPLQGTAPANFVNASTAANTTLDVTWGASVDATATAEIIVSDGAGSVTAMAMAPSASSTVNYTGNDLSGLMEGALTLTVETTDPAGNVATFNGTGATLDVTAPADPTSAGIASGVNNPADFINIATTGAAAVDVVWDAMADATATATVTLGDGVGTASSAGLNPTPSGTQSFPGINDGGLLEGAITVTVDQTDPAGNTSSFTGTAGIRDVTAPLAPSALAIPAQGTAPVNTVNLSTSTGFTVDITFDPSMLGDETADLTISDGGTNATSQITAPVGGGAAMFTGVDSSALSDGPLTVSVDVTDPAGNTTNFVGTAATQDTTPPAAPTAVAVIDSGVGVNPAGFINIGSEAIVDVQVDVGAGSIAGDAITVALDDTVTTVNGTPAAAAGGVETLNFAPIDSTTLAEGSVTVTTTITDAAGNPTTNTVTVTKDVTAPPAPTGASVALTANNPADFINNASQGAVTVDVVWPTGADTTASAVVTLDDGGTTAASGAQNPLDNATQQFAGINAGALAEGAVMVDVDVTDAAGNATNFSGTAATKDTIAPTAPSTLLVSAGASNAASVINLASQTAVQAESNLDASMAGDETLVLTFTDAGAATVVVPMVTAPLGGGLQNFAGNDLSGLADGTITLSLDLTDPAGNTTTFAGTNALKDVAPPTAPTSARVVVSGTNPIDFINAATAGATQVDVTFGTSDPTDQVTVSLADGVGNITTPPMGSGATVSFPGLLAAGLADGPVTLTGTVTDTQGNTTNFTGTMATKDTVAPASPTMAVVPSGANNPVGFINTATQGSVAVDVDVPASYDGTETVSVTLDDGGPATAAVMAAGIAGGGTVNLTGLNAGALADGAININVTVTDAANNPAAVFMGAATQDTVAPAVPTSAGIPAGANNLINTINNQTATMVAVDVAFGAGTAGTDNFVVTLGGSVNSGSTAAVASSTVMVTGIDASALADGAVSVDVTVTDQAGNDATFNGTAATKDTTPPAAPTVDPVRPFTNAATFLVSGAATPGDAVEVDDGTTVTMGTADANGFFLISAPIGMNVTTNVTVSIVDALLNRSALVTTDRGGAPLTVIQSTAAPDVPFTTVSAGSNLNDAGSVGGASFADIDNDGDLDLFVGGTGKMYTNDGAGVFTDVTMTIGATIASGRSATWGDYDEDGDQDLFLADAATGTFLLRNEFVPSGTVTFTDVTAGASAGVGSMLYGIGWTDYENDGDLDLVGIDADALGNHLLRNVGGGVFNGLVGTGIEPIGTTPRWLSIGDLDGNGFLDIAFTDSSPGFLLTSDGVAYTNVAGGGASGFVTDVSTSEGGIAFGDLDEDGDLDIIVAAGGAGNTNQFFQNDGAGNFTDVSATSGINSAAGGRDVVFGDFNHDGRLDVYFAGNGSNELWLNQGDQVGADGIPEFVEVAGQAGADVDDAGDGRAACVGDIDGDGDLDVFVGNEGTANAVFTNDINDSRFLKVIVRGKGSAMAGSNVDAVGAVVRISDSLTATPMQWRHVGGGRGAGNDDPEVLHFGGLYPSQAYDIQVTFLGGAVVNQTMVIPAMQANQTITIVEP